VWKWAAKRIAKPLTIVSNLISGLMKANGDVWIMVASADYWLLGVAKY
jgi:hypothetical protein